MRKLNFVEVVETSSKDDRYPPEALLRRAMGGKWLCKKGESSNMMSATFRLSAPACISKIDIGNCGSASVTVLVARNGSTDFKELLSSTELCTESDCKDHINSRGILMFCTGQLRQDTRHGKWDLVRVVCCQPFRQNKDEEQFGLSCLYVYDAPTQSSNTGNIERFKESAFRTSSPARKELSFPSTMTRAQKIMTATNSSLSSTASADLDSNNIFKATVLSFLDANAAIIKSKAPSDAKSELMQKLQKMMEKKFNMMESRLFSQIFRSHTSSSKGQLPSGILKPRVSNSQLFASTGSKEMEDTKMSLLKPQISDSFNTFNTQTVYWAEVVHNPMKDGPTSFLSRSGKENSPYILEKNTMLDQELINAESVFEEALSSPLNSDKSNFCRDKVSPKDVWKNRNDIDRCDSRDCSPDTWLKRKSDPSERCQPMSKKRPRENSCPEDNDVSINRVNRVNRITPSGGWLLNGSGIQSKKLSPQESKKPDSMKFPFRVSPPPPPDRPASPLPLVDDINQPSTSSRETVAERNIRLDMERRLAERSPPEQVVQRTSAGKVKGPFCTKGMNTNDSPLRRLSICDETEEFGSPQARRKLSFLPSNGLDADTGELVECPVCKGFFESCDINKHLDECAPSPIKKHDDGENDEEMACPICGFWQPKDTVAAHADECAQKRYGA